MTTTEAIAAADSASPYGTRPTRWIRPVLLSLLLVVFDEQGVLSFLIGALMILVYLPRTFLARKYRSCRRDRLMRLAIYLSAVVIALGLRDFNTSLARERAERIIAAVENFRAANGKYPERLDQLVPRYLPEIPSKARLTLTDPGFKYYGTQHDHTLMYVAMPPFGRPTYHFESGQWGYID